LLFLQEFNFKKFKTRPSWINQMNLNHLRQNLSQAPSLISQMRVKTEKTLELALMIRQLAQISS
jgi:uncharacterized membrane protein YqhA